MRVKVKCWGLISKMRPRTASVGLVSVVLIGLQMVAAKSIKELQYDQTTLYTFCNVNYPYCTDGNAPYAGLIQDAMGNLYGTTEYGGVDPYGNCAGEDWGCGVVFMLSKSGTEAVLYTFTGGDDGGLPFAGLIQDGAGNFYGTTSIGGSSGHGTVFKLDPAGTETVLYSFTGNSDGRSPYAGLVEDGAGNLYGTTVYGGSSSCNGGCGVVFKVDPSGNETVVHMFAGGKTDGAYPYAGLISDASGNLYGTTSQGGWTGCTGGCGTVFKLDTSGNETVLHIFTGSPTDGVIPYAGLIMDKFGNLYGTTSRGGTGSSFGTVFKLDSTGKETLLHSFGEIHKGAFPYDGLLRDMQGNLFGTTRLGGRINSGTVFELNKTGKATVLYRFPNWSVGAPYAGLIEDTRGNLYGTTWGTTHINCCGIVFKLMPQ